jgi:hypothetical protein
MSGFEVPDTTIGLDFSETDYAGLQVKVRAGTVGEFLDLEDLAAAGETRKLFQRFGALLISWNLTCGGEPVPATYEGLLSLEPAFSEMIVMVWQKNVTSVPPPLDGPSPSGATSPAPALAQASRSLGPQS